MNLIHQLQHNIDTPGFKLQDGLLRKKNKIVVGPNGDLKLQLIKRYHSSPEAGHVKQVFYWKGLTKQVRQCVRLFQVCQASKTETVAPPGLLQPLPIPQEVWVDVSMDFI